jgi:hypothetical protein
MQKIIILGLHVIVITFFSIILLTSFIVPPGDLEGGKIRLLPPCENKLKFGIDCPTCGMTRGFCSISHLEFRKALKYNRLSFALYVWFLFCNTLFIWSFRQCRQFLFLDSPGIDLKPD